MLPDPPSGSRLQHLRSPPPPTYITLATALLRKSFSQKKLKEATQTERGQIKDFSEGRVDDKN